MISGSPELFLLSGNFRLHLSPMGIRLQPPRWYEQQAGNVLGGGINGTAGAEYCTRGYQWKTADALCLGHVEVNPGGETKKRSLGRLR